MKTQNHLEKCIRTTLQLLYFCLFFSSNLALAAETSPYGQVFLADDELPQQKKSRVFIGGGFDSANPLLDIYNAQIGYTYTASQLLEIGILGKVFSSHQTGLKERVDQEFDLIGLQTEGLRPCWAAYLTFSFIPFQGKVNLLGKGIVPFAFLISAGPGLRYTKENDDLWGWYWSLQNRLYLTERTSLEFNFTQELEATLSPQHNVTRNQLNILVGYAF